jgi:hypothetical protein
VAVRAHPLPWYTLCGRTFSPNLPKEREQRLILVKTWRENNERRGDGWLTERVLGRYLMHHSRAAAPLHSFNTMQFLDSIHLNLRLN